MSLLIDQAKVASALDAAGVPAGVREQVIADVLDTLTTHMSMRLEGELSESELVEFQQFAGDDDPAAGDHGNSVA